MQILLLTVLSDRPDWLVQIQQAYQKKIRAFCSFEIKEIKPKKHGRDQSDVKKKAESELILQALKESDFIVLLDEKGQDLDSIAFSKKMARWQVCGKKRIVFLIGGAYGVTDEVKKISTDKIRVSSLTLNHLVVQAVLLEQIYRSHTILKGLPYHNA